MSFTETTTTSWFTRIKNALVGILIGLVLIVAAIYFLFWNEGRAIQTYRSLVEGAGLVVSIDSASIDAANEGKLVHIAGPVEPSATASDPQFDISAAGAIAVLRQVEMYQWVQKSESRTEKELGGSETTKTTYSYVKEWRDRPVNSADFKQSGHDNPPFSVEPARTVVPEAQIGAFVIDGDRLAGLGKEAGIALDQSDASRIAAKLATGRPVRLNQGEVYIGRSMTAPAIGDMRVRFVRVDLAAASVVGAQSGDTLVPYKSSNGRAILLTAAGETDAAAMFDQAQSENTFITWLIRAGGLLGLFIGFKLLMAIFAVLGDVVPFIGSLIGGGTTLIALILTLVIGPVVIAIGWFAYRPLLSLAIIGGGLIVAVAIGYFKRRAAAPVQTPHLGRAS